MRIQLVVHHDLDPNSGAAGATHRLREQYASLGHDVAVYSYSDLPAGLPIRLRQVLFPLFTALRLARTVRRWRPDVIDASTGDTWLWSLVDPERRGVVLTTTCHGLERLAVEARRRSRDDGILDLSWKFPLYYGGLHLREVEATLRRADLVFFLNDTDRTYAVERLGIRRESAFVVANGIDDDCLGVPFEPTPKDVSSPLRIAQVGSWLPQKGVTYGAEALSRVLSAHPQARVTLLGTGRPPDAILPAFPAAIHERIRVVQRYERSSLPEHLRGHHICFFPTLFEGFGISLLEAMACGLAAVATNVGGPREYVRDGENGLLVPPRDAVALERAASRLIGDRDLLDRLRRAARRCALGYTWRSAAEQRLALYHRALGVRCGTCAAACA